MSRVVGYLNNKKEIFDKSIGNVSVSWLNDNCEFFILTLKEKQFTIHHDGSTNKWMFTIYIFSKERETIEENITLFEGDEDKYQRALNCGTTELVDFLLNERF